MVLAATGLPTVPEFTNNITGNRVAIPTTNRVSVLDFGADPTGTTDSTTALANAWAYVQTLLPAMPALIFPAGIYLASTFPNFAVTTARIIAEGVVRLRYTGTADAVLMDPGGSNRAQDIVFGGINPFIIECPKTGQNGFHIRNVDRSEIWIVVRGAGWSGGSPAFSGILVEGCVVVTFKNPKVAGGLFNSLGETTWYNNAQPLYGLKLDQAAAFQPASYCLFENANLEDCVNGCIATDGFGCLFIGGTMESNTTAGLIIPAGSLSLDCKWIGMDFEANGGGTPLDAQLTGRRNSLLDCESENLVTILNEANAVNCRILGGEHQQITIGAAALNTWVAFSLYDRNVTGGTITDHAANSILWNNTNSAAGSMIYTPLFVSAGGTGDTGSAWSTYVPGVTPGGGAFTTLTVNSAHFKQLGKTVWMEIDFTVTAVGTATGRISVALPGTVAATGAGMVGVENNSGKGITGSVAAGGGGFSLAFYDGSTLCATGNRIIASGVYEQT